MFSGIVFILEYAMTSRHTKTWVADAAVPVYTSWRDSSTTVCLWLQLCHIYNAFKAR